MKGRKWDKYGWNLSSERGKGEKGRRRERKEKEKRQRKKIKDKKKRLTNGTDNRSKSHENILVDAGTVSVRVEFENVQEQLC